MNVQGRFREGLGFLKVLESSCRFLKVPEGLGKIQ